MAGLGKKLKQKALRLLAGGNGLAQEENGSAAQGVQSATAGMPPVLRSAAAQGAVLLKNDGTLPLCEQDTLSIFGRVQIDYFDSGYGSGGDVQKPYTVNLLDGLRNHPRLQVNKALAGVYEKWCEENPVKHGFWGHWPRCYPEMPVNSDIVRTAASQSSCALVVIGRSSGEDRENALEKGSYYLTEEEEALLANVTSCFTRTIVVLNIGSIMDMAWLERFDGRINAVLLAWQGGMESGNAVADLLCGDVTPCGHLTDTIARRYEDYPSAAHFGGRDFNVYEEDIYVGYRWFETFQKDAVLFPFGFGLSYTQFQIGLCQVLQNESGFVVTCSVTNTGTVYAGKQAVQVYLEKPCGALGNPVRVLAAFAKTELLAPGQSQTLSIPVAIERLASYDDGGKTGHPSAYVIERGTYGFAVGDNVRDAVRVWEYTQRDTVVLEQLAQAAAPNQAFGIITAQERDGVRVPVREKAVANTVDLKQRITANLPQDIPMTGDCGYRLADVKAGRVTLEAFTAQLSLVELEAISRGDYKMNSPLGPKGNAGAFGGVLESLRQKGIPPIITTDGPSGVRIKATSSLLPVGTLLACTYDPDLVASVYEAVGGEMKTRGTDVLLAPGMNIHRNPLCGRNFEYYSEDPVLTGIIAAAAVTGLQKTGVSACPKHFACNNQEFKRNRNDSRLSERALREIYLKGFEICIKTARPLNIMTSYNKINGVWGHYHYELCTTILRGEWGYRGNVMTDWWMQPSKSREFPRLCNNAYRVRAQVDVLMPGGKMLTRRKPDGTLLATYGKPDGITLGELQRSAMHVLRMAMESTALRRWEAGEESIRNGER